LLRRRNLDKGALGHGGVSSIHGCLATSDVS
jgi:hypothetical protein